jgi:hypothetical protein
MVEKEKRPYPFGKPINEGQTRGQTPDLDAIPPRPEPPPAPQPNNEEKK